MDQVKKVKKVATSYIEFFDSYGDWTGTYFLLNDLQPNNIKQLLEAYEAETYNIVYTNDQ